VPERLHDDPEAGSEPNAYTKSKRHSEWLVVGSGVPHIILRPSILIGDSRTGWYTGPNYGLYQLWRAVEGLLCKEYAPTWHVVAPNVTIDLIHQDAFRSMFLLAWTKFKAGTICHLVNGCDSGPTIRDLCWMWSTVYGPRRVICYNSLDEVPFDEIPLRQRRFLELAWPNIEIATHEWRFETRVLDGLRADAAAFPRTSLASVTRCQERYIEGSARIQQFLADQGSKRAARPRMITYDAKLHHGLGTS